jgi:putative ABC transport system substrate-binding protein
MKTNIFCLAIGVLFVTLCSLAQAQQPKKVFRIGYLSSRSPATESARAEGIRLALRELSYVEGQNITIKYRYADGKPDRRSALVAELVQLRVDILVITAGTSWIRAAKDATKTIPIVMAGEGLDPVGGGIVESLARPGGNVTGFTNVSRALGGKRLELLKEAVPKLALVAILYDPNTEGTSREVKEELPPAAQALGLTIHPREVRAADDFDKVFAALNKKRPDGLYVPGGGSLINTNLKQIASLALKSRLPSMYQRAKKLQMLVDSWPMGPTLRTTTGVSPGTWTRFSKGPSLPISP